jgi:hypothetical protein
VRSGLGDGGRIPRDGPNGPVGQCGPIGINYLAEGYPDQMVRPLSDHAEITSHLAAWAMWRGHSCLLRPDSSGRLPGVLENASRGVGTRQTESLRHIGD